MSRWQQRPLLAPEILAEAKRVALDPVLARLYAARAVRETRQLRLDVEQLSPGEGDQGLLGLGAVDRKSVV